MWYHRRIEGLAPLLCGKYIAFVGSGGKTTLAEQLAQEALGLGKSVAITTTTRIYAREPYLLIEEYTAASEGAGRFIRVGKDIQDGKFTPLSFDEVLGLGSDRDVVLIEADGSKSRPLKYHAEYEPVIPPFSDCVIVVAGLDALMGRVDEQVFRWELFKQATGVSGDSLVTPSLFLRFFSEDALLKGVDRAKCLVLLNKYDACTVKETVPELAGQVAERTRARVFVASLLQKVLYSVERRDG